jgi:hypothetical protein
MTAPSTQAAPLAHADVVVLDYLAALWAESEDLSPELRDELMTTVADYIAMRRTATTDPIADPEQIVGRLGPPEALVAAVRRGRMPTHLRLPVPPPPRPAPRVTEGAGPADPTAVALLMAGPFVLPLISPLAGMVMVSASPRWSFANKVGAWVLALGSVLGAVILAALTAAFTYDSGLGVLVAYLGMAAGSTIAGATLLPGLASRRPAGRVHRP